MMLTVLAPPTPTVSISFNPSSTVVIQEPFTISWSSTNAQSCNQTGAIPGERQWGGAYGLDQPPSGYVDVSAAATGQFPLGLTCQSIDPNTASTSTTVTLNVVNLTASLTATPTSVTNGSSFTLTWSSTGASGCTASGGGANGAPWSGSLGTAGTTTQAATTNGMFTYAITCTRNNEFVNPQAALTVSAPSGAANPANPASPASASHGGGGAIGVLELALLAALRGLRRRLSPLRALGA